MRRTILLLTLTLLAVACGSNAEPTSNPSPDIVAATPRPGANTPAPSYAELVQAMEAEPASPISTVTTYTGVNGNFNIPAPPNNYCLGTRLQARGGSQASASWPNGSGIPNGVKIEGARFSARPTIGWARTAILSSPPSITASLIVECRDYGHFNFGPNASQSANAENLYLFWPRSIGARYVTGDRPLWNWIGDTAGNAGICFIDGIESLSHAHEGMHVYQHGDGRWHLWGQGYPQLGGWAKCIYPNRPFEFEGPFSATPAATTWGIASYNSICVLTKVVGVLDEALIWIREQQGAWTLVVGSPVDNPTIEAEMWCARFP